MNCQRLTRNLGPSGRNAVGAALLLALGVASVVAGGCGFGPAENGSFDKTLSVSGPARLEITNPSGEVRISGSATNQIKIRAEVHARGWLFQDGRKTLNEVTSNPPVEQSGNTIRIGKNFNGFRNVSIDYTIEVPSATEVDASSASGTINIGKIHGPVKVNSASGSIRIEQVEHSVQVNSASGSVVVSDLGDDLRVSSASGSITATNVKGDTQVHSLSGSTEVFSPGGRVTAETASGSIEIRGANNDVKSSSMSGSINVRGNPTDNSYWNLRTVSGSVNIAVPPSSAFHFTAEAVSGEIRTGVPIMIEEQGKHTLRARMGDGGGRVEVHTTSGEINVKPAS